MSIAYHAVKTYGFERLGRFNATTVLTGMIGAVRVGVVITQERAARDAWRARRARRPAANVSRVVRPLTPCLIARRSKVRIRP